MFIDSWKEITGDQEILSLVQGCKIKFKSMPIQSNFPHPFNMSKEEEILVGLEVQNILAKGAIEICSPDPNQFISNIFTIPKKDEGRRPVVDMPELNQFAEYLPFKMEDISQLKDILRRGDCMTKLDLQGTYLTIPIGPKSKIFQKFFWKGVLYQFTYLPFGLSPSARLFTKKLKPVIAFLRSMGIRLLIFLDDILIMADSLERAAEHTEIAIRVLKSPGFMIKKKKSILKPTQTILFLGFIVNSIKMLLLLPEEKLRKLKSSALSLLENVPTAREILSFLGQCQAALPALQMALLHFRAIQGDLIQVISPQRDKVNYGKTISLSEGAIKDLFW